MNKTYKNHKLLLVTTFGGVLLKEPGCKNTSSMQHSAILISNVKRNLPVILFQTANLYMDCV